jgi:hypothetical protein
MDGRTQILFRRSLCTLVHPEVVYAVFARAKRSDKQTILVLRSTHPTTSCVLCSWNGRVCATCGYLTCSPTAGNPRASFSGLGLRVVERRPCFSQLHHHFNGFFHAVIISSFLVYVTTL